MLRLVISFSLIQTYRINHISFIYQSVITLDKLCAIIWHPVSTIHNEHAELTRCFGVFISDPSLPNPRFSVCPCSSSFSHQVPRAILDTAPMLTLYIYNNIFGAIHWYGHSRHTDTTVDSLTNWNKGAQVMTDVAYQSIVKSSDI